MGFDDEDEEGVEEDLDDDGTLGMDRLQVHTVDLGEAGGGDDAQGKADPPLLPRTSSAPASAR